MIEKTKIKFKKGVACLLAALQIGVVPGCTINKSEDGALISKEEYESLLDELEQKGLENDELSANLEAANDNIDRLESQVDDLQSQVSDLNNSLNDLDYLREKLNKALATDFGNYLKENNTAKIDGEIDIKGDYWRARRYKFGDEYKCVIDITGPIPINQNSDSRLKEIIGYLHLNAYLDYPGSIELNISLDNLAIAHLSDIPFEEITDLNILPSMKMEEINADFTMPSFDGELTNIYFDNTFNKISKNNLINLISLVSKHNGNITIDRLTKEDREIFKEISEDIEDMHFKSFACYWVDNECLDTFKYIPAKKVTPVIYGKYSYYYLPNATYTLNDYTEDLSLMVVHLKEGVNVKSNHSVNLNLTIFDPFYDVEFNLPENSNIDLSCWDYALFTENTLESLSQYNVTYNDGKSLQSDADLVKELNTLSKNIKLEMLENKEYRRFKITLNIPKEGISEKDYLDLENIISFCNTYGENVCHDLTVNAYNEKDLDIEMVKHLYFTKLRNLTFNNYGGNISFLNVFNELNKDGYSNLTFNNYSKVNDYDLLNKVVSNYTADAGEVILNSVEPDKLYITYGDGGNDAIILPSEAQVQKLISYGYSEEEAWEIVNNKEYDKIFYFYVYVNGEKNIISYEKTYSFTRTK